MKLRFQKMIDDIKKTIEAYRAGQLDKRTIRKFAMIVGGVAGAYLIIASVVTVSLVAASNNAITPIPFEYLELPAPTTANGHVLNPTLPQETDDGNLFRPPARTNVLILGIDEFNLADVIIVGSFHRDTGDINLLHIPRDTFTQLPQERIDSMTGRGLWVPSHGRMKINALRSLGGSQYGVQYMKDQLGETLGIPFHYYVEIDLDAFREIVDLMGGVEIEVPQRMTYYDPYQDLHINIQPGLHLMDGRMAEHFVRYRGYADADLGRINAQQQFMTQLFRQAMRRETIMQDPVGIARIGIRHVNTDISLDLFRYIPYVGNLSPDRIHTYTLPGSATGPRIHGISYFVPDGERVPEVINRKFFGVVPEAEDFAVDEESEATAVSVPVQLSHDARIAVLNGTRIGGVASTVADHLHMAGYQIAHIAPFTGMQEYRTRINVREAGMGEDLLAFFRSAEVLVDERMDENFDIVIIVGRSEQ
ncbi:MAG: LCP family protein [Defluviitaleaceae bacterium]|nr:LCP family protein [Defluviitaleaceae bacterium]